MPMQPVLIAIEAGGTSFKVAISPVDKPHERCHIKTFASNVQDPLRETVQHVVQYIQSLVSQETSQEQNKRYKCVAIGIASFGPVDLHEESPTYGYITTTPKRAWQHFDLVGQFQKAFPDVPIGFETDVNAPAMAEFESAKKLGDNVRNVAYITVGTGVGVGLVVEGNTVHGLLHAEGGHVYVPLAESDSQTGFRGVCPFHGTCIEGMASSNSIAKRKDIDLKEIEKLADLPDDDPVWDTEAHYLAHLCLHLLLICSMQKIVLGGGVMKRSVLLPKIHTRFLQLLNGYVQSKSLTEENIDKYIVVSEHGSEAGIVGAVELARRAIQ